MFQIQTFNLHWRTCLVLSPVTLAATGRYRCEVLDSTSFTSLILNISPLSQSEARASLTLTATPGDNWGTKVFKPKRVGRPSGNETACKVPNYPVKPHGDDHHRHYQDIVALHLAEITSQEILAKVGEVSNETPTLTHWRDLHKCHSEGSYSHNKTLMSN